MNSAKVLALSLLLVSPLALARVQLNTFMQINDSTKEISTIAEVEPKQLDFEETKEIYANDAYQLTAKLVHENGQAATILYTVAEKDEAGVFQNVSSDSVEMNYNDEMPVFGWAKTDGASGVITVKVNKI